MQKFWQQYRWYLVAIVLAFAFGMMLRPTSHPQQELAETATTAQIWTCSMHPQIRQPEPGKCPICAMDLIPVSHEDHADLGERQLRLSANAVKLAAIQTTPVLRATAEQEIHAFGKMAVDETQLKTVSAWVPGRIEKMYVDFTGAQVRAGEPLLQIYSPDLYVAQQEYLQALQLRDDFPVAIQDIEKKFELWGFSKQQLDELAERGTASERMTVFAPMDGVVLQRQTAVGDYVKTGSPLFAIADLSQLWLLLQVYEKDMSNISLGQTLTFTVQALPGQTFSAQVDFIDPLVDEKSRTIRVRAVTKNKALKPGLLAQATLHAQTAAQLLVPASAVLQTGERAVVYVAVGDGVFEGRNIQLGSRVGEQFMVQSGLQAGENVVTHGAFKIDSEMQILAKKSMMSPDGGTSMMPHQHEQANMQPQTTTKMPQIEDADMLASLDAVYLAYFNIQDALSHDKFADAQKNAASLKTAIQAVQMPPTHAQHWHKLAQPVTQTAEMIASADNIAIARSEFKKMSNAMIQTAIQFGHSKNVQVNQFHCPMAFNNAGADWLSPKSAVENPYYGAAMFSCGSRLEKIALPADGGH